MTSYTPSRQGRVAGKSVLSDLASSVVVFLVALPLCLGIALASDAPLFAGLVSGIVGGLVIGFLSGSHTSVSGPAAGLTAVVAAQLSTLGSFDVFLTALVLAGLIQVGLGLLKAGGLAKFVPSSVIKGLLAAIGLILIIKQVPHLIGHDGYAIGSLQDLSSHFHAGATLIGLVSLAVLMGWKKIPYLGSSAIPGPLVVVLLGVAVNEILARLPGSPIDAIDQNRLVQVPVVSDPSALLGLLQHPDPSALMSVQVMIAAITIALVASLETLLNLEAVDRIDPQKRTSPPNRELLAQGVGNTIAGLLGGLPVTSVIVRSSVNINSGGKTKRAAILHGAWLLVAVVLIPTWINRIPFAVLAAVLVATGFKLAHPTLFRDMWARGWEVFLPFATTVFMILATDLLVGVLCGLTVGIVFILRASQKSPIRRVLEKRLTGDVLRIELPDQVTVLNRSTITHALDEAEPGSHVLLDARQSRYIDADILSTILDYQQEVAPAREVRFETIGLRSHYEQAPEDVESVDYVTRELRDRSSPGQILQLLEAGNERFRSGRPLLRDLQEVRTATATQQHPLAVVFSGTSSRTPVEAIFDVGVGTLSCVRTTGNTLSSAVLGSLEYAVVVDSVKVIVVMGHTRNEAVRRAISRRHGDVEAVSSAEHLESLMEDIAEDANSEPGIDVDASARCRTAYVAREILDSSTTIRRAVSSGAVRTVCCMYDIETGHVEFYDMPADVHGRVDPDLNLLRGVVNA